MQARSQWRVEHNARRNPPRIWLFGAELCNPGQRDDCDREQRRLTELNDG
jgi:hypothetical protein